MAFEETRNDTLSSDTPEQNNNTDSHSETPQQVMGNSTSTTNPPEPPNAGVPKRKENNMTEDFATALESFEQEQTEAAAHEDRVIKGTVVSIVPNKHLVVDIGTKSEGVVPISEATDHEGNVRFQPGDPIDVMVEKGHTEEGYVNLSHQKAQRLHAWDEIEKAYNEKSSIKVRVIDRIKGGLTVDIMGARAFLPGSQVDTRPVRNLEGYKNQ